jgi:hypothetical protein
VHHEICNIVLWTPICLGCRDGNGLAIALVLFDVVITGLDDLVLYWERNALSASIASHLVELEVFDLYSFRTLLCPSSPMRAESGHYYTIGTFGFHRAPFISGDSASCGYLVISSKDFALFLLETNVM